MEDVGIKKRRGKAEDLIGKTFNDGKLLVVGIADVKDKNRRKLLKVICSVCSEDKELFPDGYFISSANNLRKGHIPCGCSKSPKLSYNQWMVVVDRVSKNKHYTIRRCVGEPKGILTRVECECLLDNYKWETTIHALVHLKSGCRQCSINSQKLEYSKVLDDCIRICNKESYIFLGFDTEYKNKDSKIRYMCPIHGKNTVSYHNFVYHGSRCSGCATHGYNPSKQGSFYVVKWAKCDHSFIKFGITNRKILSRIKNQAGKTNYNYEILFQQTWADGSVPLNIERAIKQSNMFNVGVIDINNFEDGFTETLDTGCLENLLIFVENILQTQPV